ncbi:hypothetical protein LJB42_002335 [Komagataella kurtzmanii]|nr:hypothetical protein LJB42_002335 [Komagataella kurtzmanii]
MVFDKFKVLNLASSIEAISYSVDSGRDASRKQIFQSRNSFGVNFGSLFVLEKYIYGDIFIEGANCELDAVKNQIRSQGVSKTKEILEKHYQDYINDDDWAWLKDKGVEAIRIPVGYWHVDGGSFTSGTNFEKVSKVYADSWKILKERYIEKANQHDIGVLLDLHALPSGANSSDHSGELLKRAGFWDSSSSILLATKVVEFIARDLSKYENVVDLQIVNESDFDNHAKNQKRYYAAAINAVRKVDPTLPIVISDGWWPDQWVQWISEQESKVNGPVGVVIDHHVYRCFSDDDRNKSPQQIIDNIDKDVLTNLSGTADFIIGEYSCVLDGRTWEKSKDDRNQVVAQYGKTQSRIFQERAKSGSYFWTYKFEYGDGGEWGFRPMLERGCIERPVKLKGDLTDDQMNASLERRHSDHVNYWSQQCPNESFEHQRFKDGFIRGWKDALSFAEFNGSRLGRVDAWKKTRVDQHIKERGGGKYVWEYEQGLQQGVSEYEVQASS